MNGIQPIDYRTLAGLLVNKHSNNTITKSIQNCYSLGDDRRDLPKTFTIKTGHGDK